MIAEERRKSIIDLLRKNDYTALTSIFSAFPEISASTLRRDLQALTAEGKVVLLRGGAKLGSDKDAYDLPIYSKFYINTQVKKRLSMYAASLISDKDVVYLDASTSVYPILQFLEKKKVTIVTTGIYAALKAMKLGIECITVGGNLRADVGSFVGSMTLKQLEEMHFDLAFMSSNGISQNHGISTPHAEEAAKIKTVLKNSERTFFIMDSSKVGYSFTYKGASLDDVSVITDANMTFAEMCKECIVADNTIEYKENDTEEEKL